MNRVFTIVASALLLFGCGSRVPTVTDPSPVALPTASASPSAAATEARLLTVAFVSATLGVVGGQGVIERTEDGGLSWTRSYSGDETIWNVRWLDLGHVFAASDQGLLMSDDAGRTWSRAAARDPLVDVQMLSPTNGFAISGVVALNSGWLPLNIGMGGRRLLGTDDAGRTWSAVDTGLNVVQSAEFVNSRSGWAAGPDGIVVTADGGRTWRRQFRVPDETYAYRGTPNWSAQITLIDERHGFALYRTAETSMSKSGKDVYYTDDGGDHWELQSSTVRRPWAADASDNYGGGADGPLVISDRNSARYLSASVAAPGTFLEMTRDRGRSWTSSRIPYDGSGVGQIAVRDTAIWVVLSNGVLNASAKPAMLRSLDGGNSWLKLR
jgi:photosystem II stability/assembly factor-like uncharacterized protein